MVAETQNVIEAYVQNFFNPLCFLQYYDPFIPPSDFNDRKVCTVGNDNYANMSVYTDTSQLQLLANNTILATLLTQLRMQQCLIKQFMYTCFDVKISKLFYYRNYIQQLQYVCVVSIMHIYGTAQFKT